MHLTVRLAITVLLGAALLACSSGIDQRKFDSAAKAARSVQASIDRMDNYEQFGKVFDQFANEVIQLRGRVATDREQQLFRAYSDLLATYQDGYQLWEYKVESTLYPWVPEGRIYLEPKIKQLALKYHLPVESHVVELTGHAWKSVPADSLKIIWERARVQLNKL